MAILTDRPGKPKTRRLRRTLGEGVLGHNLPHYRESPGILEENDQASRVLPNVKDMDLCSGKSLRDLPGDLGGQGLKGIEGEFNRILPSTRFLYKGKEHQVSEKMG